MLFIKAYYYILENHARFLEAVRIHMTLSLSALLVSIIICVPLGIICSKFGRVSSVIMNIVNGLRVIPSLAILIIVLPVLGTGFLPALIALAVLACPPILINTFLAFRGISPSIIEAACGMGMNNKQILFSVEFPLAMPLIIAGIRTAAVEVVASATLAAFIGGGGLGIFIINGLGMYNFAMLLVGAAPVALLAVMSEMILAAAEKMVTRYQRD